MITLTLDEISPSLARAAALARDPSPVLRALGEKFQSITERNFTAAGAAMRPFPWAPKKDGSPSNLILHNILHRSFVLEVTPHTASVSVQGEANKYAWIHQFGGIIPKKKMTDQDKQNPQAVAVRGIMPARPFFPVLNDQLTPAAAQQIAAAGQMALDREMKK